MNGGWMASGCVRGNGCASVSLNADAAWTRFGFAFCFGTSVTCKFGSDRINLNTIFLLWKSVSQNLHQTIFLFASLSLSFFCFTLVPDHSREIELKCFEIFPANWQEIELFRAIFLRNCDAIMSFVWDQERFSGASENTGKSPMSVRREAWKQLRRQQSNGAIKTIIAFPSSLLFLSHTISFSWQRDDAMPGKCANQTTNNSI